MLDSYPLYKPTRRDVPKFSGFSKIMEDQVKKIIKSMPSTCCDLNVMSPIILKQILPSVITPITKLTNESSEKGVFADKWKTAIIKQLLKKWA